MADQSEAPKKVTKIPRSVQGNCPKCHRPMQISYGLNRCPSCGFIFKSNFKVQ
ncbi:50S ribosomal protein L4 [Lentilactobacillus kisonensis]|uniref:50S ribosomal protein L37Ae domain protein n=1 Tax=Lentilactobacillus kisonensis F0435 TaxID=797516 RepID=H1LF39_9LACO|nr:50S ribosomal protein L4 [Lentilactobacillus kisonensis]EHO52171.1 50S ribosomal protein L37Ae domain protein [Lentilactobacillus kisonensis F0435]